MHDITNNWLSILMDLWEVVVFSGLRINDIGIMWMIFCSFSTLFRPLLIPTIKNYGISSKILLSFSSIGNIYRIFSRKGSRKTIPICSAGSLYLFTVLQLQVLFGWYVVTFPKDIFSYFIDVERSHFWWYVHLSWMNWCDHGKCDLWFILIWI